MNIRRLEIPLGVSSGLHSGRVRSLEDSLEANYADDSRSNSSTDCYPIDLGAIFVSLELSKSAWLVTALSPGCKKMSRQTITGDDITGLL